MTVVFVWMEDRIATITSDSVPREGERVCVHTGERPLFFVVDAVAYDLRIGSSKVSGCLDATVFLSAEVR